MVDSDPKQYLIDLVRSFLTGRITHEEFADALDTEVLRTPSELKRGAILRLKHGDRVEARRCLAALAPCRQCSHLPTDRAFADWSEFEQLAARIDALVSSRVLTYVKGPPWPYERTDSVGQEAFVRCAACGALWRLVLPERASRGSLHLIG